MRVWLFALSMIVALTSGPTVSASPLGLTDCQVNPQPSMNSDSDEISKALVQIAGVVAAHERNNQPAEIAEAKEVATAIAKLQPQDVVGILNIFEELREIGRLSHEASLQIAHALISDIDPVARQRSEVD